MIDQYIETALWSSILNDAQGGGEPFDQNYDGSDLADETCEQMEKDCTAFEERAGSLLDGLDLSDVGHDFWLTRNGHGAGFWDGDYEKEIGEKLTALSKEFGECNLYLGDDGKIYA